MRGAMPENIEPELNYQHHFTSFLDLMCHSTITVYMLHHPNPIQIIKAPKPVLNPSGLHFNAPAGIRI